jgi:cation diffusion facilitator family transporter
LATTLTDTRQQVRQVLLTTLILNFVVAVGKIGVGLFSGALAITADGFHSLIDGLSNVAALIANRIADQPPDDDHPYGHRRFETLAALLIGGLLLVTAWEIVGSAARRLLNPEPPNLTPLTFAVLIGTLIVNLFVSTYERRAGKRLHSELLLADAANTSADVFVTLAVLASSGLIALTGWLWLDSLAALVIVVLIGRAAYHVLRQTSTVLVDTAPFTPEKLIAIAESVPSVDGVIRARSRGTVDAAHIDIDVQVAPATTAENTAAIAAAIRDALESDLGNVAEVEVHFAPQPDGDSGYARRTRAQADALGLSAHEIRISECANGRVLELHVEVPPGETLGSAHERVSQLETRLQASLPDVDEVLTHIEPALNNVEPAVAETTNQAMAAQALDLLRAQFPEGNWHNIRQTTYDDGAALALHMTLPAHTTVEVAHTTAEAAETFLRARLADLRRVTIHTEPPE